MNFRKSKSFGIGRVTATKSGLNFSIGTKGARVSLNTHGDVNRTIGIPGTGIYDRKKIGNISKSHVDYDYNEPETENNDFDDDILNSKYAKYVDFGKAKKNAIMRKRCAPILLVIGIIMVVLSLLIMCISIPFGIFILLVGLLEIYTSRQFKKRANISLAEFAKLENK